MSIETFDDLQRLRDDEAPKQATLEALYRLYYSSEATGPSTMDAFTEELRANLHRVGTPPTAEETEAVLAVLTTEIKDNYGDSPDTFAQAFLLEAGWLSAEVLSDATDMFQELWLHEESGNYYDALGNWYDSNRQPLQPSATATATATIPDAPERWLDTNSGLYYDAHGNWYDADGQPWSADRQLVSTDAAGAEDPTAPDDGGIEEAKAQLAAILMSELTPEELGELTDDDIAEILVAALTQAGMDV